MNSVLKEREDYLRLHNFIVSRIYHEDSLLSQRTYNFVTINTFLVAGLAITFSISQPSTNHSRELSIPELPSIISIFGISFAFLHLVIGRATERAIVFWREYLRALESIMQLKFDSAMFEFYKEGIIDTGFDIVISRPKKRGEGGKTNLKIKQIGLPLAWLPSSLSSTNVWVGVLIPWLAAAFWFSVIVILLYRAGECGLIWFLATLFVIFFVVSWFPPFTPATPRADPKVKNENNKV